jgi:predicted RND superfamily exporter protein
MIQEAVGAKPFDLKFGSYVVSGAPVVAEGASSGLSDAAPALVVATLLLVALALVLGGRLVVLPLALGAGAAAITLGGAAALGGAFDAGTAAALPLLCALGAGWALRLVTAPAGQSHNAAAAIATAALVSATTALALLLSPVSMTRSFGVLLAAGLLVALLLAITAGAAVTGGRAELTRRLAPMPAVALPARVSKGARAAWRAAHTNPGRVLRIALALAVLGVVAGTQIDVTSDQRRLLAADSLAERDLSSLVRETGTPGDVNLLVRSDRLLDPAVVRWMSSYQRRVLREHGFRPGRPCGEADLCPALSLTNLFGGGRQSARQIRQAVQALPRYFSQNVITADRRTANIGFRLGDMAPEERRDLIADLRAELDPPAGVDAELAGPVVSAADGESALQSSMWLLAAVALLLVAVPIAVAGRSTEAGLMLALPLGLAVGWTFLILFLLPVDVDFLTAALGAILVAIWAGPVALFAREHRSAHGTGTTAGTAKGLLSIGALGLAGFLALTVCDVPALRDLGVAGAVAMPLSGLGLALAVPATLVWAERRGGLRVPRSRAELAAAARSLASSPRAAVRATAGGGRRAGRAVRRGLPRAGRKVRAAVTFRR